MINTLNIITKKLNKVSDEEYFTEFKKLGIRRYLVLCIIGLSISSIIGLAQIFLR